MNLKVYLIGGIIREEGSIPSDLEAQQLGLTSPTEKKKKSKETLKPFIEIVLLAITLVLLFWDCYMWTVGFKKIKE